MKTIDDDHSSLQFSFKTVTDRNDIHNFHVG